MSNGYQQEVECVGGLFFLFVCLFVFLFFIFRFGEYICGQF